MRYLKIGLRIIYGVFFIAAGFNHFAHPDFYLRIIPPYFPDQLHWTINSVSGFAEVILGLLMLIPATSRLAGWGYIALLIAVFPANIYVFQNQEIMPDVSPIAHLIRLPLQAVMILWAYWYTLPDAPAQPTDPPN